MWVVISMWSVAYNHNTHPEIFASYWAMEGYMQDIDREISEKFNLNIKNIVPFKDAHIVNTTSGKKILRISKLHPDKILFVHGAKEHLFKNNFANLDRYLCTIEDDPYIYLNGGYYTLVNMIEGRECNLDNREDTIAATRLLASFHKASKGYIAPPGSMIEDDLGKIPLYFNKRLSELKKLKKIAKKGRSKFDYLFLDCIDYFYGVGDSVIKQLENSGYNELVCNAREDKSFCHHDFTHRNIFFNDKDVYLTSFDYCCYELKVYDIANFLRRKLRKCNWNVNEARIILDEYVKIEPISDEEFNILKLMLLFPQKFWRVANKYYNSKRSWTERIFTAKLQEVIDEVSYHEKFIKNF